MKNTLNLLLVLGAFAGASACGGDDDTTAPVNGGPGVVLLDASTPDAGNRGGDGGVTSPSSGNCPAAAKTTMADFLNGCSPTKVQTASKPTLGLPAGLLDSNGNVQPL